MSAAWTATTLHEDEIGKEQGATSCIDIMKPEKPTLFVTNENTKSNLFGLCKNLKAEHYANKTKSQKPCSSVFMPQNCNPGLAAIN